MTRSIIILSNESVRQKALDWVAKAPLGTRIEFKGPKRNLDQNSRLWAALGDIAEQKEHAGRKWPSEVWKLLFMDACQREVQFVPNLEGTGVLPWGKSSSDLSKAEMSDLLAFIEAWGTENGVMFHASP